MIHLARRGGYRRKSPSYGGKFITRKNPTYHPRSRSRSYSGGRSSSYRSGRSTQSGCYIATCVYGSYDCPEVWVLRRYRDINLSSTRFGRLFVRIYYCISPILVKLFGKEKWFTNIGRKWLDSFVLKLRRLGFSDAPYKDKKSNP
ncbi:CFI-box-CTERM domain-containing protein [Megasphaera sp. UBA4233]|uniref:CFI-box-CTERM domain-containing protein n=1 Tax=Megasphaera sp. UBA4233 TaxID=1946847 RepID=UPI0039C9385A